MKRPNILLISIDSLRADYLSMYGGDLTVSPYLHRFAADAAIFTRAYSAANWTGASIASLLTGLYPTTHGYTNKHYYLDDSDYSIASILQKNDYHTICFSNNMYLSNKSGLHAGFDEFLFRGRPEKQQTAPKKSQSPFSAQLSTQTKTQIKNILDVFDKRTALQRDDGAWQTQIAVQKWLQERNTDKPFFAYIHYQEPHSLYFPPLPYRRKFHHGNILTDYRYLEFDHMGYYGGQINFTQSQVDHYKQLYTGEIAYMDWRLGQLFEMLQHSKLYDDTIIIVTADHGELFGENNYFWHAFCLYEPLVRVPLLGRFPAWFTPGEQQQIVQTVDVVPTLLAGLDIAWPFSGQRQGQPLTEKRDAALVETYNPEDMIDRWLLRRQDLHKEDFRHYQRDLRAFVTAHEKLIHASDGRHEQYALTDDSQESKNIYDSIQPASTRLVEKLQEWVRALPEHQADAGKPGFDKATWESMKDLGYA